MIIQINPEETLNSILNWWKPFLLEHKMQAQK